MEMIFCLIKYEKIIKSISSSIDMTFLWFVLMNERRGRFFIKISILKFNRFKNLFIEFDSDFIHFDQNYVYFNYEKGLEENIDVCKFQSTI